MKIFALPFWAIISLLFCCLLSTSAIKAQNLLINLNSGITETYALSEVQSIKFGTNTMVMHVNNGTEVSWLIDDIASYSFDTSVSVTETEGSRADDLSIYPNPAVDLVRIEYKGADEAAITIEIMDLTGKRVASIFEGRHQQETRAIWNPKSEGMAAGTYLCRITAGSKMIIKKIVVQ